jgi:putative cardiolipin synthase
MRAAALVLACVALAACARLPDGERTRSSALGGGSETRLGRALAPAIKANPGKSGIYALADGRDAFAARVLLARSAERSLDLQYYIWRGDTTGGLLYEALWQAAGCGCSSTTTTPATWTRDWRRWTRTPTSRCACSIPT